ncbi:hypothetical protein M0R45_022391 [Rubus argutus]|uniref:Uncharacterized protein n=1 Tax=Rubus argutus TaxID=59490 RepID=A0AAW1XEC6_RUBAR
MVVVAASPSAVPSASHSRRRPKPAAQFLPSPIPSQQLPSPIPPVLSITPVLNWLVVGIGLERLLCDRFNVLSRVIEVMLKGIGPENGGPWVLRLER